ncbi:MAG: DMT family transporter [Alphaproteobacteria bacterium]|nr:DMT family transporter [Alphaproteobacteria bacterium]
MTNRSAPPQALALLALLTLLWGTNWPLFRLALEGLSVWSFRTFVAAIAAVALFGAAKLRGERLSVPRRLWLPLLAASIGNITVWGIATTVAVLYLPSGQASILAYTMPLWLAPLAAIFLGQRFTLRLLLAILLGIAAVTLLMIPNFASYAHAPLGLAAGLSAGFAWAVGTVVVKRTDWGGMGLALTAWQVLLSVPPIALGFLLVDGTWPTAGVLAWAVSVYIALVPMAIGTATWFALVHLLPAQIAGLSSVCIPVVAVIAGVLLYNEPLGPLQIAALACAVAALYLALVPPRTATPARA